MPTHAVLTTGRVDNVPAMFKAVLQCFDMEASSFFVGVCCGFPDDLALEGIPLVHEPQVHRETMERLMHVQKMATDLHLQRRQIVLLFRSPLNIENDEFWRNLLENAQSTLGILPVLVQERLDGVRTQGSTHAIDKTSFDLALVNEHCSASTRLFENDSVVIVDSHQAVVQQPEPATPTAAADQDDETTTDDVRKVIVPVSRRRPSTVRKPRCPRRQTVGANEDNKE